MQNKILKDIVDSYKDVRDDDESNKITVANLIDTVVNGLRVGVSARIGGERVGCHGSAGETTRLPGILREAKKRAFLQAEFRQNPQRSPVARESISNSTPPRRLGQPWPVG
jgi:hypothetical protein